MPSSHPIVKTGRKVRTQRSKDSSTEKYCAYKTLMCQICQVGSYIAVLERGQPNDSIYIS